MEVDQTISSRLDGNVHTSVNVLLHPLVLLNISEHWTRIKVLHDSPDACVYGALLGKQGGRNIEISNSFELLPDSENSSLSIQFFNARESQCKQVYPDLEFVGWYATGGPINEQDKLFNCQMQVINESTLIVKLNPTDHFGEQLPVRVYECVVDNDAQVLFKQVSYTLAQEETERIGIDHVARISTASSGNKSLIISEHLINHYQAIQMLSKRLYILREYVAAVLAGEQAVNRSRLRELSALLRRLPLIMAQAEEGSGFRADHLAAYSLRGTRQYADQFLRQANDVCLSTLLGSLTQGLHTMQTWLSHSNQLIHRSGYYGHGITGGGSLSQATDDAV